MILLATERLKPLPVCKNDCVNISYVDSDGSKISEITCNVDKDMLLDYSCFFYLEDHEFTNLKGYRFVGVLIDSKTHEIIIGIGNRCSVP